MSKSQLRLLAAEAAEGRIPRGEYRARRRELIDNIVAGTEAIECVQAQRHNSVEADDSEATTLNNRNGNGSSQDSHGARFRLPLPAPVLLAAGSVLCIALLTWLLWPTAPEPVTTLTPPTVPSAEEISRARALVESFVARRDFSADAIDSLQRDWQQIEATEREQAQSELWFGSLVRALRDEIKTQKALAGLSAGDAALARAQAVYALGEFLGVSDKLPRVDNLSITSFATPDSSGTTATASPTPAESVAADESSTSAAESPVPAKPTSELTGRQWLTAQTDDKLTLQIFAVNSLDRVEQLLVAHPTLEVHVLATEGALPRYRIFHGVFADEESARQAYAALPAGITKASHGAIVKSFSVVRADLGAQTTASVAAPAAASTTTQDAAFALQLFATGNRDGAEALVKAFPALKLQLREIAGDPAPYRVVYGEYASADDARAATATLPATLLARIGRPLPKPLSSLGTPAIP